MSIKIGTIFDFEHAAGITRWRVKEKDNRYLDTYECVAIECVKGTHTSVGSIGYYGSKDINEGLIKNAN